MRRILGIIFIIAVLGVSAYLISAIPRSGGDRRINDSEPQEIISASEEWLGIFLQGQRIGYSFSKLQRSDAGLIVENNTSMTLIMMNEQRTLSTRLFAHTDAKYTLEDFILEITTPGHASKIQGIVKGTQLELTSFSQGIPHTQLLPLKEKPFFPEAIKEVIREKNLRPGDEITIPYFDPTTQSSTTARIRIHQKESVDVLGAERTGIKVEINAMGIVSYLWLDDDFRLIKESSPAMGMEMIPLTRDQALAEIRMEEAFDLLSFFSVKLEKEIPDPPSLSRLTIGLENITRENLDLTDEYQVIDNRDPLIITVRRAFLPDLPSRTIPLQENTEYLQPSVYIQCQNEEIITAAQNMIGSTTDAQEVVAKLVTGVYTMLKKNPTASLPSAIDVLRTKEGDCNEHAILFTALARAVGIPTKIYVGLVNLEGAAYYYHAWCAVWLGAWVPVDPTFNQFPADVGHLKLKEGGISEQAKVLKVVGQLAISIKDYAQ